MKQNKLFSLLKNINFIYFIIIVLILQFIASLIVAIFFQTETLENPIIENIDDDLVKFVLIALIGPLIETLIGFS